MSVNYTTVIVTKAAKRKSPAKREAPKPNHGSGVLYTTILHAMPPSQDKKASAAERNATVSDTSQHLRDPGGTYRVCKGLPKEVDLVKGDEIACTTYKEDQYFMKGRVMGTGQACHLPADCVERSSHSKYTFIVMDDYSARDVRRGDIIVHAAEAGWRETRTGLFLDQNGNSEMDEMDECTLTIGDIVVTHCTYPDVLTGTNQRTGQGCSLPIQWLEPISEAAGTSQAPVAPSTAGNGNDRLEADGHDPDLSSYVTPWKKVVIVGDPACGKTWLLSAFAEDRMPEEYVPTVLNHTSTGVVVDETKVDLSILDTGGAEDHEQLRLVSYQKMYACIVCYAIDNPESLWNIREKWEPEVRRHSPNVPIVLVGNKKDLFGKEGTRQKLAKTGGTFVKREEASDVARAIRATAYLECSAKTEEGVREVLEAAASSIFELPLDEMAKTKLPPDKTKLLTDKTDETTCTLQ